MNKNYQIISLFFLLTAAVLALSSCDFFNPSAVDDILDDFTRDNPDDFGVWTKEATITSIPQETDLSPVFSADNYVYTIAKKWGDYDPEIETHLITEYSLGIIAPQDNWLWTSVGSPDLTLDTDPEHQSFRHEQDSYFVDGDTLYWLANGDHLTDNNFSTRFQAFHPESGVWDDRAPFPSGTYKHTRTADASGSGKVYVSTDYGKVYEYDPDTDAWRDLNTNNIRSFEKVLTIGDTLWILDCYMDHSLEVPWQTKELNAIRVHSIDLTTGGITQTYQRMNEHMEGVHCFTLENSFYVFTGGITNWSRTATTSELLNLSMGNEVYKFDCDNPDNGIQKVGSFPDTPYIPMFSLDGPDSFLLFCGSRYTEGGIDDYETGTSGATAMVYWAWEYTPSLDSWTRLKDNSEEYSNEAFDEDVSFPLTPFLLGNSFYISRWDELGEHNLIIWSYKLRSYD